MRADAAAAVWNIAQAVDGIPEKQRFNYPSLRPCVPELVQMLGSEQELSQDAAAGLLFAMSVADSEAVAQQLATPSGLSALSGVLSSKSTGVAADAAAVLCNVSCGYSAGRAMLAASSLVVPQLLSLLSQQAASECHFAAAACILNLLKADEAAARSALAAVPGSRGCLEAGSRHGRGSVKQQCREILALI